MENQDSSIEKEVGIKYKYLSMIEKGKLADPVESSAKKILDLFDIKIPNLYEK
jgi:hypothetical protein